MIFWLLLSLVPLAQAQWTSIATPQTSLQYFRYGDGQAIEQTRLADTPLVYRFWASPAPARKVCATENRPGVYWYTPDGRALNHTFPTPNPGEFTVSALQTGIRGFGVQAAFAGSAKHAGAVEVAYFADRACSDGSVEYGFSRDLATDSVLVYWSTFANCGNDAASLCRKTDNGALGEKFSNVQQEDSGASVDHGFRIFGLENGRLYRFMMFVEGKGFRVEVWTGDALAFCSEVAGGKRAPCSFWKGTGAWFPLDQIGRGFVIAGTQRAGDPGIEPKSAFVVSDILVAK